MVQDSNPRPTGGSRVPLPLIGALVVVIAVGLVLVVVALGGGGGDGNTNNVDANPTRTSDHDFAGIRTAVPTPQATLDLARATALAPNLTSVAEGDRLIIEKFGINAPLSYKEVGLDGLMPDPNGPDDVAYYNFSAWPGLGGAPGRGGNVVLAGHVDSGSKKCKNGTVDPPCAAVFWDVSELRIGDIVEVQVSGQSYRYRVTTNQPVSAKNGPWNQIVASTAQESITLITCGGDFNRQTREYDSRQVVTAVKI